MKSLRLLFSDMRYLAPAVLFLSLNIIFSTWAIYIPRITKNLDLSEADLGLAVFFVALGTLLIIPTVPRIIKKFRLGRVMTVAILSFCLLFSGPFLATNYISLCVALFCVGLTSGLTDVCMNTLVTHLEKKDRVQFMSLSHAFFSLGGMLGAGIGSLVMPFFPTALIHVLVVIALVVILNLFFIKYYVHIDTATEEKDQKFQIKNLKPLLGLAVIGFIVMAAEGAIGDWSALYLERVTLAATTLFGLGYAVFNGMMAIGRFFGDSISNAYGSRIILIGGCFLASMGFGLVLTADTWLAILGFGIVGLGLSVVVPELFRYCGNLATIAPVQGISFVSGTGFVGLLLGPVALGFLAETFSLKSSFIALLVFTLFAALLGFRLNTTKNGA